MSSVKSFYAQRDNRLIDVPLTGNITDNGVLDVGTDAQDDYNAAVASVDVSLSKLFKVDTRSLVLRSASGPYFPVYYLVGIVFTGTQPPQFYPGFEINIIINVKDTNVDGTLGHYPLVFRIQKNPSIPIDYANEETYIELNNVDYGNSTDTDTTYTYGNRVITLLSSGEDWVMKSSYLNNGPSSIFM